MRFSIILLFLSFSIQGFGAYSNSGFYYSPFDLYNFKEEMSQRLLYKTNAVKEVTEYGWLDSKDCKPPSLKNCKSNYDCRRCRFTTLLDTNGFENQIFMSDIEIQHFRYNKMNLPSMIFITYNGDTTLKKFYDYKKNNSFLGEFYVFDENKKYEYDSLDRLVRIAWSDTGNIQFCETSYNYDETKHTISMNEIYINKLGDTSINKTTINRINMINKRLETRTVINTSKHVVNNSQIRFRTYKDIFYYRFDELGKLQEIEIDRGDNFKEKFKYFYFSNGLLAKEKIEFYNANGTLGYCKWTLYEYKYYK